MGTIRDWSHVLNPGLRLRVLDDASAHDTAGPGPLWAQPEHTPKSLVTGHSKNLVRFQNSATEADRRFYALVRSRCGHVKHPIMVT